MGSDFSRTLSLLRQEKKVSQRKTAQELGVSQALLSHYENGVREPGLAFVVRAADYYAVSTDYLLGRTMSRDGASINISELTDGAQSKDNQLRGSAAATLSKKLVVNSSAVFFDILGKCGNLKLIQNCSSYFSLCIYKLFRLVYMLNEENNQEEFPGNPVSFAEKCDMHLKQCEAELREMCTDSEKCPDIELSELKEQYPQYISSLFSVLHSVSDKLEKRN